MIKKVFILIFLIATVVGGYIAYKMYQRVYQPNVTLENTTDKYFYIYSDYDFDDVVNALYEKGYIINRESFSWVAEKKANFKNNIHPGRYLLKEGMNNDQLIDLLRSGVQIPAQVTFNNVRTISELSGKITKNLECDRIAAPLILVFFLILSKMLILFPFHKLFIILNMVKRYVFL